MKIGFIGAGKVGCSLGKYFADHGLSVNGYYDEVEKTAYEAALFTNTKMYTDKEDLIERSDTLFLTVPDGAITSVWEEVRKYSIEGKIICHCSGALSAGGAFSGIRKAKAFGYSIHPLFAVSDKYHSHKELSTAFFTIEGHPEYLQQMKQMLEGLGNLVQIIDAEQKIRYHAAAAISSNLVIGLVSQSMDLLVSCGFSKEFSEMALKPLMLENMKHLVCDGPVNSLTGPVERGDTETVSKHLACLEGEELEIYRLLSRRLIPIAKLKHPDVDYSAMERMLDDED